MSRFEESSHHRLWPTGHRLSQDEKESLNSWPPTAHTTGLAPHLWPGIYYLKLLASAHTSSEVLFWSHHGQGCGSPGGVENGREQWWNTHQTASEALRHSQESGPDVGVFSHEHQTTKLQLTPRAFQTSHHPDLVPASLARASVLMSSPQSHAIPSGNTSIPTVPSPADSPWCEQNMSLPFLRETVLTFSPYSSSATEMLQEGAPLMWQSCWFPFPPIPCSHRHPQGSSLPINTPTLLCLEGLALQLTFCTWNLWHSLEKEARNPLY